MSRTRSPRSTRGADGARADGGDGGLGLVGATAGEAVRWRRRPGSRWCYGTVRRREQDGSIGVTDDGGRARSLPVDRLEVRRRGTAVTRAWEPFTVRAARAEQLCLPLELPIAGRPIRR